MLRLADSHVRALFEQPESGMGYQIVEATLPDYRTKRGIAYNSELLVFDEESRGELRTASHVELLNNAKSSTGEIRTLRVVPRASAGTISGAVRESASPFGKKAQPAKDAPQENTTAGEVFNRFSAYEKDNRVMPDGSLRDGSYATTEGDAKNVKTGKDAVARYALPNPSPASWRFTIKPEKDTAIQRGVVEPAYGQPGGGVEVIFTKGTQPKTVTGPDKIPDE